MNFIFLNHEDLADLKRHKHTIKSHISGEYRKSVKEKNSTNAVAPAQPKSKKRGNAAEEDSEDVSEFKKIHSTPPGPTVTPWKRNRISIQELCFEGTRVDPFNAFPVDISEEARQGVDFYTQVFIPSQDPLSAALGNENLFRSRVWPLVLQRTELFQAAVVAGHMLSQAWSLQPKATVTSEIWTHRQNAVKMLKEKLERPHPVADVAMIIAVVSLINVDLMLRDMASFFNHWTGLRLLVDSMGGLDHLGVDWDLKSGIVHYDYQYQLLTGAPGVFEDSPELQARPYPDHPFTPDLCNLVAKLPAGFRELALQRSLSTSTIQVLQRIEATVSPGKSSVIPSRSHTSGYAQLDIYSICSSLHKSILPKHILEKSICLGMVIYSHFIVELYETRNWGFRTSRMELGKSLMTVKWRQETERQCLVWLWTILITSWRLKSKLTDEGQHFLEIFINKFPEEKKWMPLEKTIRKFFWSDTLSASWSSNWDDCVQKVPPLSLSTSHRAAISASNYASPAASSQALPGTALSSHELTDPIQSADTTGQWSEGGRGSLNAAEITPYTPPETPLPTDLSLPHQIQLPLSSLQAPDSLTSYKIAMR